MSCRSRANATRSRPTQTHTPSGPRSCPPPSAAPPQSPTRAGASSAITF
jgi:hypothetical protein